MEHQIPTSTTNDLPGYTVRANLGLAFGVVVRSMGFSRGVTGGLRAMRAGEVPEFTEVVAQARVTAMQRLEADVQRRGGNAVLGVRFDASDVGDGVSEIFAYGTAVVVAAD